VGETGEDASAALVPGPATDMARAPVATTEQEPMAAVSAQTAARALSRLCTAPATCPQHWWVPCIELPVAEGV